MSRARRAKRRNRKPLDRVSVDSRPTLIATADDLHHTPPETVPAFPASTRRGFIKGSGLILAGGTFSAEVSASEETARRIKNPRLRVGLIGCGSRGTAHAIALLSQRDDSPDSEQSIHLVGMADAFEHRLQASYRTIRGRCPTGTQVDQRRHSGPDAFRRLLDEDVDVVVLAAPTSCREKHFREVIQAGKHCLVETPLATRSESIDHVIETNQMAIDADLIVVSGLQRVYSDRFRQAAHQVRQGIIGDLLYARVYTSHRSRPFAVKRTGENESMHQLANWQHFREFIGDPSDEAILESIAMLQVLVDQVPAQARGQSGAAWDIPPSPDSRLQRRGDVATFRSMEYEYANGLRLFAQTTLQGKGRFNNGFFVHGTLGSCDLISGVIRNVLGKVIWQPECLEDQGARPSQTPAERLLHALRSSSPNNEVTDAAMANQSVLRCRHGMG